MGDKIKYELDIKANEYFKQVVTPAIEELIEEYKMNGLEAGLHGDTPLPGIEHDINLSLGIWVTFPNAEHMRIAVCWPEGTDKILVGNLQTIEGGELYSMDQTDNEFLKEKIRELIQA